jgi:predicted nucleic acid-binding protein
VAYLFDTDAISEVLKKRPAPAYLRWLKTIPRDEQFTSAVVIGELYTGAFKASNRDRHLHNVEKRVLPSLTVLPYEVATTRVYGAIRAELERTGRSLADADLQIAATGRVPGLTLAAALTAARLGRSGVTERPQSPDRVRGRRSR